MKKETYTLVGYERVIPGVLIDYDEMFEILGREHVGSYNDDHIAMEYLESNGWHIDPDTMGLATETGFLYPLLP